MIPFRLTMQPGVPLYEQVVYAVKRAIVSGQMLPGDPFPSVRTLSRELKINPNTAHKVVTELIAEGLLEVRVGVGTVVAQRPAATAAERSRLLKNQVEQLVVEAKKLGLDPEDIFDAISRQWKRLSDETEALLPVKGGRLRR